MTHNAEVIATAIAALKPTPDYLKDYVVPFIVAFFSALFGGMTAIYINRQQEIKTVNKNNYILACQILMMAQECLSNLVAIKSNYADIESDEPLVRAGKFPTILSKLEDVAFNSHTLYFIRSTPTANKSYFQKLMWIFNHKILNQKVAQPSALDIRKSWRNILRISAMFSNYNQVMGFIRFRNDMNEKIKQKLSSNHGIMHTYSVEEVSQILGKDLCCGFVHLTESIIAITDYLMVELNDFLKEFPVIAESNIELSRIKEWGRMPTYVNSQEAFLKLMEPILKPNFTDLSKYTGLTEEILRRQFNFDFLI